MAPPQNPHDSLFKATFTDRIIAADYIRNFLPPDLVQHLDLDSLLLEPGSYITPELEPFYSDIVYQCMYGKRKVMLTLLFEHKSSPPRFPHVQLLRYMIEAWEQSAKNKGSLRVIIPIIVYHGKRKWHIRPFHSYFGKLGNPLLAFIPEFDYHLTDLREWSDEALLNLEAGLLINTFLLFKHYGEEAYIRSSIRTLFIHAENYLKDENQRNQILSFFVYLWTTTNMKDNQFIKLIDQLPTDIKKETMTTYEQILQRGEKRGKKEGEKIGKEIGKKQGQIEKENLVITNAHSEGFREEVIAKLTGLSVEEVLNRFRELGIER